MEILNKENQALKQTSHNDASTNTWINARSRGPCGTAFDQLPKIAPTTHDFPVASQYQLPIANRYNAVSSRYKLWEHGDRTSPTKFEQTTKPMPGHTNEHTKGLRRKNAPVVNQHKRPVIHQRNKHNLHELSINEDKSYYVPTIVNGETKVNYPPVSVQKYSDSTKSLIQNLREIIKVHNKKKVPHSKRHRIILIGDSNIKGHASNLKSILSNNSEFYSITKLGSKG